MSAIRFSLQQTWLLMTHPQSVGVAPLPRWKTSPFRRLQRALRTLSAELVVLIASVFAMNANYFAANPHSPVKLTTESHIADVPIALAFIATIIFMLAFLWRPRTLVPIIVVANLLAWPLPISTAAALICLPSLLRWQLNWITATLTALTWANSVALTYADTAAGVNRESAWKSIFLPASTQLETSSSWGMGAALVINTAVIALIIALGVAWHYGDRARQSEAHSAKTTAEIHHLQESLADTSNHLLALSERQALAREIHDSLGHTLSRIKLQAEALRNTEGAQQEVLSEGIRACTQEGVHQLRNLVETLKDPHGTWQENSPLFSAFPQLIADAVQAGQPIMVTSNISQPEKLAPEISRILYRICQELLNNARKHAPNAYTNLKINYQTQEITITSENALDSEDDQEITTGAGLNGIAERATRSGGSARFWTEHHNFYALVSLPLQNNKLS